MQGVCSIDGQWNGMETDLDCGGLVCPPCPTSNATIGQVKCWKNADCQSGCCYQSQYSQLISGAIIPTGYTTAMTSTQIYNLKDVTFSNTYAGDCEVKAKCATAQT